MLKSVDADPIRTHRRTTRVAFSAVIVITLAAVFLASPRPSSWPAAAALRKAVDGADRGVAVRLSRGFRSAPPGSPVRSTLRAEPSARLVAAAAAARLLVDRDPTPEHLHDAGIGEFLLGRRDTAIGFLERAVAATPRDPALLADVSAAYLDRGIALERPLDVLRGLAAAERSREVRSTPEGLFNLAVAIEQLHLPVQARAAWQAYLRLDVTSPWMNEGRRRLASLISAGDPEARVRQLLSAFETHGDPGTANQLALEFPRNARDWVEDTALPRWGDALLREDATAARWASRARTVVRALQARSSDTGITDLIPAAIEASGPVTLTQRRLAEGFRRFGAARELYERDAVAQSGAEYEAAAALLAECRCSTAVTARIGKAVVVYFARRLDDAAAQLAPIAAESRARHYESLEARVHWMQGIILGAKARFTESLAEYQLASEQYERIGETDNAAVMQALMADAMLTLGDVREAWRHLDVALSLHRSSWNPRRQYTTLLTAARAARQYGSPEASRPFYEEILRLAPAWGPPGAVAEAHLERARSTAAAGQVEETRRLLDAARALLGQVSDTAMHWRVETQLLRARAEVSGDPSEQTIANLERALDGYARIGSNLQLAGLELALGRELRRAGRTDQAEEALRRGISHIEAQRQSVLDAQLRISHFDRAWDLYGDMVALSIERGDDRSAFEFADRGRARSLLDVTAAGPTPTALEVARALPAETAAVYYAVLPDRWVAWVLSRGTVRSLQRPLARNALVDLASRIQASANASDEAELTRALDDAYDAVLRPVVTLLGGAKAVYVVPDGPLNSFPFAALRDHASGTFFGAHQPVAVAPNARSLMALDRREAGARAAFVVSAALAGRDGQDDLPALQGAAVEAERIAALYRVPLVKGQQRTVDGFLASLSDVDVVHFAGHAIANPEYPLLSRLILDPRPGGAVFAYQFNTVRLRTGSTVVLAACDSAAGPVVRGEGVLSLARPFVASGAGAVVASLWPLNDRDAPRLFEAFHAALRQGRSAEEALWDAQGDLRRSSDPRAASPLTWGGVIVMRSGLSAPQAR